MPSPSSSSPIIERLTEIERSRTLSSFMEKSKPTVPKATAEERLASKIMIVDDEPLNIRVVRKYLEQLGYHNFVTTSESTDAVATIQREDPDVVILDVMMPVVSGIDILEMMRDDPLMAHIPVLILTAAVERETRLKVLDLGATDFLSKPVDPSELAPRIRNALVVRSYENHLANYAEKLEREVAIRTAQLEASRLDVIHCLARAAEFRDDETGRHVVRVGRFAGVIGRQIGMSQSEANILELAAQLHDVGKIGIPDAVLLKPGKLCPDEYDLIQKHCGFGKKILERMPASEWERLKRHTEIGGMLMDVPSSPILDIARQIALTHHEWWDGSGYPIGLRGDDIPLEGRITAIADVFDALSSKRPYKPALPVDECFRILEDNRATQFDPELLDAFFTAQHEIIRVQIEFADVE